MAGKGQLWLPENGCTGSLGPSKMGDKQGLSHFLEVIHPRKDCNMRTSGSSDPSFPLRPPRTDTLPRCRGSPCRLPVSPLDSAWTASSVLPCAATKGHSHQVEHPLIHSVTNPNHRSSSQKKHTALAALAWQTQTKPSTHPLPPPPPPQRCPPQATPLSPAQPSRLSCQGGLPLTGCVSTPTGCQGPWL